MLKKAAAGLFGRKGSEGKDVYKPPPVTHTQQAAAKPAGGIGPPSMMRSPEEELWFSDNGVSATSHPEGSATSSATANVGGSDLFASMNVVAGSSAGGTNLVAQPAPEETPASIYTMQTASSTTGSAFSFITGQVSQPEENQAEPEAASAAASGEGVSSFSFISASQPAAEVAPKPPPAPSPPATSAFSFVSSSTSMPPAKAPSPVFSRPSSSGSAAPSPIVPQMSSTSAADAMHASATAKPPPVTIALTQDEIGVKKKKMAARRPGYAAKEDGEESSAAPQERVHAHDTGAAAAVSAPQSKTSGGPVETEAERLARLEEEEEEAAAREMERAALELQKEMEREQLERGLAQKDTNAIKALEERTKQAEDKRKREAEEERQREVLRRQQEARADEERVRALREQEAKLRVEEDERQREAKRRAAAAAAATTTTPSAHEEEIRHQQQQQQDRQHAATAEPARNIYGIPIAAPSPTSIYATGGAPSPHSIYGTSMSAAAAAAPSIYAQGEAAVGATSKGGIEGLESTLAQIRGDAERKSAALRRDIAEIASAQAQLHGERQETMRHMGLEREELERLEAAQSAAQESEDFEEAARLVDMAEAATQRLQQLDAQLGALGRRSEGLDDKRHELQKALVRCWADCARVVEDSSRVYVGEFEQDLRRAKRELERSQEEIDDQKEQVKHELEHLHSDMERISEERGGVEKAVADKTSVQRKEAAQREAERHTVRQEIEKLLAQLKIKQEDEARLTSQIEKIGREISDVTAMYGAKLAKLDERQSRAEVQEKECAASRQGIESAESALVQRREDHCKFEAWGRAVILDSNKLVNEAQKLSDRLEERLQMSIRQVERRRENAAQELRDMENIAKVRDKLSALEHARSATASKMLGLQQRASQCRSDIAMADARMPELEDQKRVAVAAKSFKDAARLSGEIKELAAKRDALVEAKQQFDADVMSAQEELEQHSASMVLLQQNLAKVERDAAVKKHQFLSEWARTIRASIAAEAQELGEGVDAQEEDLYAQLTACEAEMDALRARHGFAKEVDPEPLRAPPVTTPTDVGQESGGTPLVEHSDSGGSVKVDDQASMGGNTAGVAGLKSPRLAPRSDSLSEFCMPPSGGDAFDAAAAVARKESLERDMADLESKLQQLVEAEDFDGADMVQASIEKLQEDLAVVSVALVGRELDRVAEAASPLQHHAADVLVQSEGGGERDAVQGAGGESDDKRDVVGSNHVTAGDVEGCASVVDNKAGQSKGALSFADHVHQVAAVGEGVNFSIGSTEDDSAEGGDTRAEERNQEDQEKVDNAEKLEIDDAQQQQRAMNCAAAGGDQDVADQALEAKDGQVDMLDDGMQVDAHTMVAADSASGVGAELEVAQGGAHVEQAQGVEAQEAQAQEVQGEHGVGAHMAFGDAKDSEFEDVREIGDIHDGGNGEAEGSKSAFSFL